MLSTATTEGLNILPCIPWIFLIPVFAWIFWSVAKGQKQALQRQAEGLEIERKTLLVLERIERLLCNQSNAIATPVEPIDDANEPE